MMIFTSSEGTFTTGFAKKDTRLLKYFKSIFSMILHSLSSLSGSGIFFNFKKRLFWETLYMPKVAVYKVVLWTYLGETIVELNLK